MNDAGVPLEGRAPKRHRFRNILIACVIGTTALGVLGGIAGHGSSGQPPATGPAITAPWQAPGGGQPVYSQPGQLTYKPPVFTASATTLVVETGYQGSYADITVTITNGDSHPMGRPTINLYQGDQLLVITDTGGCNPGLGGASCPDLGVGATAFYTLRVDEFKPGVPITVKVGGNGVDSKPVATCPTKDRGQFACTL